jgi:hypothetical protein
MILTDFLDQVALIFRIHHPHHLRPVAKPLAMVIIRMVERSLKRFGIHRKTKMSPVLCSPILGGEAQSHANRMTRKTGK